MRVAQVRTVALLAAVACVLLAPMSLATTTSSVSTTPSATTTAASSGSGSGSGSGGGGGGTTTAPPLTCSDHDSQRACDTGDSCQWIGECGPCLDTAIDTSVACETLPVGSMDPDVLTCQDNNLCVADFGASTAVCRERGCFDQSAPMCACDDSCELVQQSPDAFLCKPAGEPLDCGVVTNPNLCQFVNCSFDTSARYCHEVDTVAPCSKYQSGNCPTTRTEQPCEAVPELFRCIDEGAEVPCDEIYAPAYCNAQTDRCEYLESTLFDASGTVSTQVNSCIELGSRPPCARISKTSVCRNQEHCYLETDGRCYECESPPCDDASQTCEQVQGEDDCEVLADECKFSPSKGCTNCTAEPDAAACRTTTTTPIPACSDLSGFFDCQTQASFCEWSGNACQEKACWGMQESTCNRAPRGCTFQTNVYDGITYHICIDPVVPADCPSIASPICAELDGCGWYQNDLCFSVGEFPCSRFLSNNTCPRQYCKFDPTAQLPDDTVSLESGLCYDKDETLTCDNYPRELACKNQAANCKWEPYTSKCLPIGEKADCSALEYSPNYCRYIDDCRYVAPVTTTTPTTSPTTTTTTESADDSATTTDGTTTPLVDTTPDPGTTNPPGGGDEDTTAQPSDETTAGATQPTTTTSTTTVTTTSTNATTPKAQEESTGTATGPVPTTNPVTTEPSSGSGSGSGSGNGGGGGGDDTTTNAPALTTVRMSPCQPCDDTSCATPLPNCSNLDEMECLRNSELCSSVFSNGTRSCQHKPCDVLSSYPALCDVRSDCKYQLHPGRCVNEGAPLNCRVIFSSVDCDLTPGCSFLDVIDRCEVNDYEPICSEIVLGSECELLGCEFLSSISLCVDAGWVPDCSVFRNSEFGCNSQSKGACAFDSDLFAPCNPNGTVPECTQIKFQERCEAERPRCDFDFVRNNCQLFNETFTTPPPTTTTTTINGCDENPCIGSPCIQGSESGTYTCEPCPEGTFGEPDTAKNGNGCQAVSCDQNPNYLPTGVQVRRSDGCTAVSFGSLCGMTCLPGYRASGSSLFQCAQSGSIGLWEGDLECTDIAECEEDNPCDPLTNCSEPALDETACTACPAGYEGTGKTGCKELNECDEGACDTASCINYDPLDNATLGRGFECGSCPAHEEQTGQTVTPLGTRIECTNIDECADYRAGVDGWCSKNARSCLDVSSTLRAVCGRCKTGYEGTSGYMRDGGCLPRDCGSLSDYDSVSDLAIFDCDDTTYQGEVQTSPCVATCPGDYGGNQAVLICNDRGRWTGSLSCELLECNSAPAVPPQLPEEVQLMSVCSRDLGTSCYPIGCKPGFRQASTGNRPWTCGRVSNFVTWTTGSVSCVACGQNEYQDQANQATCKPHLATSCSATQITVTEPSTSSPLVCRECSTCEAGFFVSKTCNPAINRNTECTRVRVCSLGVQVETVAPTPTSDRICSPCSVCPKSTFVKRDCDRLNDRMCQTYKQCELGVEVVATLGDEDTDRTCKPLTLGRPETGRNHLVKTIYFFVKNGQDWLLDDTSTPQAQKTMGIKPAIIDSLTASLNSIAQSRLPRSMDPIITLLNVTVSTSATGRRRLLAKDVVTAEYLVDSDVPTATYPEDTLSRTMDDVVAVIADEFVEELPKADPTLASLVQGLEANSDPQQPAPTGNTDNTDDGDGGGSMMLFIAAGAGGAVVLAVVVAVCCYCRRSKSADLTSDYDTGTPLPMIAETSLMMEVPQMASKSATRSRQASFYSSVTASSDA
eukprot:m.446953 g.446953  ORF g.446953 m.446953 type:complete len:1739 (-) comp20313_c1_seq3:167-5383(-)